MTHPLIIQGGMGMGVSNWVLARAVSRLGQLGVISGTAIDTILARRLQDGDPGGHMRRGLAQFPKSEMADRILKRFFLPGGRAPNQPYKGVGFFNLQPSRENLELTIVANFVEVYLAKEGHSGIVGINLLEKIQLPNPPSLYGAMLAGVDYVLMGAGIPREIPAVLDHLSRHESIRVRIPVDGAAPDEFHYFEFDPKTVMVTTPPPLHRPFFLPIVASSTLAINLAKKSHGRVDGFIVEGPLAGGHNAPPRGKMQLTENGEPLYGPRDEVDLRLIKEIGLPFWLAGSFAENDRLRYALGEGATGVQIGTAFAFCKESGIREDIKRFVLREVRDGRISLFTDPRASPTGFPFKIVALSDSISEESIYLTRDRICDLGYLRTLYKRSDGTIGYRCPGEPVNGFVRKGGTAEETDHRKCLCNGLQATIGLAQRFSDGTEEPPLLTSGEDIKNIARYLAPGADSYSAEDVVNQLLSSTIVTNRA